MTSILYSIAGWALPILLGPLVYVVARQVLNAHYTIDALPPWVKRLAVVALGTLSAAVLNALGVAVPVECVSLPNEVTEACAKVLSEPTVVRGLTAGVVAIVIHAIKKSRSND